MWIELRVSHIKDFYIGSNVLYLYLKFIVTYRLIINWNSQSVWWSLKSILHLHKYFSSFLFLKLTFKFFIKTLYKPILRIIFRFAANDIWVMILYIIICKQTNVKHLTLAINHYLRIRLEHVEFYTCWSNFTATISGSTGVNYHSNLSQTSIEVRVCYANDVCI